MNPFSAIEGTSNVTSPRQTPNLFGVIGGVWGLQSHENTRPALPPQTLGTPGLAPQTPSCGDTGCDGTSISDDVMEELEQAGKMIGSLLKGLSEALGGGESCSSGKGQKGGKNGKGAKGGAKGADSGIPGIPGKPGKSPLPGGRKPHHVSPGIGGEMLPGIGGGFPGIGDGFPGIGGGFPGIGGGFPGIGGGFPGIGGGFPGIGDGFPGIGEYPGSRCPIHSGPKPPSGTPYLPPQEGGRPYPSMFWFVMFGGLSQAA